jgi:hypothetical protein
LWGSESNTEYFNCIKSSFENRRTGWRRIKFNIIERTLDTRQNPFVNGGTCLKEPFKLSEWISEYTESINHVSLEFLKNTTKDISFLGNFPNLESVCFLGAKFNDNMMAMIVPIISGLQSLFCLLHNCKMGNYLSKIAKACKTKIFVLLK